MVSHFMMCEIIERKKARDFGDFEKEAHREVRPPIRVRRLVSVIPTGTRRYEFRLTGRFA